MHKQALAHSSPRRKYVAMKVWMPSCRDCASCVCVYICVYVCMYICIYVCSDEGLDAFVSGLRFLCMCVYMCGCVYVHMYICM